jgi:predicted CopG family antitoxin
MSSEDEPFRSISVRRDVRDRVRSLKRGGESYTSLLDRMAKQYQPPESGAEEP